jgi:hypothetical protein
VPVPVVPEETLHRQVQLPQEQTLVPVVAESHPPSPVHRFVMRLVAVEQSTGTVALLVQEALVLRQTQLSEELVAKVALRQTLL